MLSEEDGKTLLKLARDAIIAYFYAEEFDFSQYRSSKKFSKDQGVFVTLKKDDDLRGCIGFPEPVMPLYKAVFEAARAAAFEDPRFRPVKQEEMESIEIEISVLTVPKQVKAIEPEYLIDKIDIGEDGLIIRNDLGSGLLLPQVFTEHGATAKDALEMTCEKAGLERDAWKSLDTKIFKFQAQIFCESDFKE
ncbi:AmmeMemoRadiSam system protein A [Candidatus Woesearchaeota archaeon]|nr:AmmeMemoRadiSam system protein A [Candidatus Woesearchaeota archaeon]